MTLPIFDEGIASGLFSGILFGYVLENAGFGSPRKLTAQLRLSDWSVFKVMFTAIIVAAVGLYLAGEFGLMQPDAVYVPTTFYWATLAGGVLLGAGMAIGGYCPGTSIVGAGSGRVDGLFFMLGMVFGTGFFAAIFEQIKGFYEAASGPDAQTLSELLHIPTWLVLSMLILTAILGFWAGVRLEKPHGGALTAEQVDNDDNDAAAVTSATRLDAARHRTA